MASKNISLDNRVISSEKYFEWLVNFTDTFESKAWDDENVIYAHSNISQYDLEFARLLLKFNTYVARLAEEQYVTSLPHGRLEIYRYHIKLCNNFYEISAIDHGSCIATIKKISNPNKSFVYVDEKMPIEERKKRELVQYILLNKDVKLPESVYSVHIAHACTIAAINQSGSSSFNLWYGNGDKQKIIILDASSEKLEELETDFFGIRDTGHNDIPKDTLVALSLGVMSKENALKYIEGCTLHTGAVNGKH